MKALLDVDEQKIANMSRKLEINFNRLLNRCETIASNRESWDWRLEKVSFILFAVRGQNYLTLLCSDIIFGLRNFRIALKRAVCEKYGQGIRTRDLKYRDNFHSVSILSILSLYSSLLNIFE